MALSAGELAVLRDYARTGSMKDTGANLGLTYETVRSYYKRARGKVGGATALEMYGRLGWLVVPPRETPH